MQLRALKHHQSCMHSSLIDTANSGERPSKTIKSSRKYWATMVITIISSCLLTNFLLWLLRPWLFYSPDWARRAALLAGLGDACLNETRVWGTGLRSTMDYPETYGTVPYFSCTSTIVSNNNVMCINDFRLLNVTADAEETCDTEGCQIYTGNFTERCMVKMDGKKPEQHSYMYQNFPIAAGASCNRSELEILFEITTIPPSFHPFLPPNAIRCQYSLSAGIVHTHSSGVLALFNVLFLTTILSAM